MSLEVAATLVEPQHKSAASKEWQETLSHDAERARHIATSASAPSERARGLTV